MHDEVKVEAPNSKPEGQQRPYTKPQLRRIELTIEESLVAGCKHNGETGCTLPQVSFDPGS